MKQQGFTLIELVVVIVILGILAATAIPKFVDLKSDAAQAAANGTAGGISSSASVRYAASQVNSVTYLYVTADACSGLYLENGLPATCSTVLTVKSCAVTCSTTGTATVIIP